MEPDRDDRRSRLLVGGFLLLMPPTLLWLSAGLRAVFGTPASVGRAPSALAEALLGAGLPLAALGVAAAVARKNPRERRDAAALAAAAGALLLLALGAALLRSP